MALNQQQLAAILTKMPGWFECVRLYNFANLPSTNQKLWELLAQGAKPGTVVIATQQTAGRGQWGREWISPPGGLYLSMAIAPDINATQSYQLTMASAWGIAQQLRDRDIPVGLKWPNDLVIDGYKLGGILTETKVQQGKIVQAVVGVGINWNNQVPPTGINLTALKENQIDSLEMLAALTIVGIASGIALCAAEKIDTLLDSYQNLLTNIGEIVTVNDCSGIIVGVTPRGELRVSFNSGVEENSSPATEIYFQPGAISLGYG